MRNATCEVEIYLNTGELVDDNANKFDKKVRGMTRSCTYEKKSNFVKKICF